ncbi:MAG TPA: DUF3160 domain-containing protein [Chryseosolibacter sp.]|nr:DUF3160 domain-containing protein [Chryseosolibacter sp.]
MPIKGKSDLAKGALSGYYEFTCENPLTDEEWQTTLLDGRRPTGPSWTSDIIIRSPSLESKPGYSF